MNQRLDLPTIVENGLCVGCGLCESLAGAARVQMVVTPEGRIRPQGKGTLSEEILEPIRQVCPGIGIQAPELIEEKSRTRLHPIFGPIRRILRGWAKNEQVRYRSAAGGVMTALGAYLLESGEVDAVLHVSASEGDPVLTQARVSLSMEDVQGGSGSRYGPAAPLRFVHRLLDAKLRFAVMAKPCDVAAIRKLARIDPRVDEQVAYLITFFCGGVPSSETARKIVDYHGVGQDEVSEFRFRGHGWPGPTHVGTRDGQSFQLSYEETWFDSSRPWRYDMQFRCKVCADAVGESADVVCPDGWLMKDGRPIYQEAPGVNLMIARTERGERLLERAQRDGVLQGESFPLEELESMHADHIERKLTFPARVRALRAEGLPAPDYRGLRDGDMVKLAGPDLDRSAEEGTRRRLRAGNHREEPA